MMFAGRHAILTHVCVGDGIIQTGLAVALLERYQEIAFPTYPENLATFRSIFIDCPRITVYPVPRIPGEDRGSPLDSTFNQAILSAGLSLQHTIRLGIYAGRGISWNFARDFYDQARIPYEAKWRLSPIAQVWDKVPQIEVIEQPLNGRRIFVHDDLARGFVIQPRQVSKGFVLSPSNQTRQSILRYAAYMIEADEIHVIDSAFFWLADALPVTGRLYLHRYPRWQRPADFRYETFRHWNHID